MHKSRKSGYGHPPELRCDVFGRDGGICQHCGLDTMELWNALEYVERKCANLAPGWWPLCFRSFKAAVGKVGSRYPRSLWDVNLIVPKSKGGAETLFNSETLCLACHRKETNRLIYGKNA